MTNRIVSYRFGNASKREGVKREVNVNPEHFELMKYLVTNLGFSAVILVIWYFSFKQLIKLVDSQTENNNRMFQLLKDMIDVNILQVGKLDKIEELIHSNRWCPYLKKIMKGVEDD